MKNSIKTFLKHPTKDNSNRSANPAVIRASTILFNTMQELYLHEKKIKKHQKISHYSYGRYGSSTIRLASEGIKKSWSMRRDSVSPCYTTSFDDLVEVKT